MWIVMTSSAKARGNWGGYRNVNVVNVRYDLGYGSPPEFPRPSMISERAIGVFKPLGAPRAVIDLGAHKTGTTDRCAYRRAIKRAEEICARLNNAPPHALPQEVFTWGGSA